MVKTQFGIALEPELLERLKAEAARQKRSVNQCVGMAIDAWLHLSDGDLAVFEHGDQIGWARGFSGMAPKSTGWFSRDAQEIVPRQEPKKLLKRKPRAKR